MKADNQRTLLDHWLWEPRMLRAFVTAATALPILTCIILVLTIGQKGFQALVFLCFVPIFGIGYGLVGKRIARIRNGIAPDEGVAIPGLIVRGKIEAAGILVMG
jgi:hypothetical protein